MQLHGASFWFLDEYNRYNCDQEEIHQINDKKNSGKQLDEEV